MSSIAKAKDKGPCAGVDQTTDPFGVKSRGTTLYVGYGNDLAVSLQQTGPDKHLQMLFFDQGAVSAKVPAGTAGKVALADGTVLLFTSSKDAQPTASTDGTTIMTQRLVEFPLSQDALTAMAASPIAAVSTEINGQPVFFNVPAKKAPKLQAAASCLMIDQQWIALCARPPQRGRP